MFEELRHWCNRCPWNVNMIFFKWLWFDYSYPNRLSFIVLFWLLTSSVRVHIISRQSEIFLWIFCNRSNLSDLKSMGLCFVLMESVLVPTVFILYTYTLTCKCHYDYHKVIKDGQLYRLKLVCRICHVYICSWNHYKYSRNELIKLNVLVREFSCFKYIFVSLTCFVSMSILKFWEMNKNKNVLMPFVF